MITRMEITLSAEKNTEAFRAEWAYRLYADYLKDLPQAYAEKLHKNNRKPVSQHLKKREDNIVWTVNLLGEEAEEMIFPVLQKKDVYHIEQEVKVLDRKIEKIEDANVLFAMAADGNSVHKLEFETATAFKSQGRYVNLPTISLIFQNLIQKWNSCFPEILIEDENREGMNAMVEGIYCPKYSLHNKIYTLKGTCIHGFSGEMVLKNQLTGFHKELADVLLLFAKYSGIGIKTTLGMGGIQHIFQA